MQNQDNKEAPVLSIGVTENAIKINALKNRNMHDHSPSMHVNRQEPFVSLGGVGKMTRNKIANGPSFQSPFRG